ncbi:MAG: DUF3024 domain-containing protein [Anaerolineales bacterium]
MTFSESDRKRIEKIMDEYLKVSRPPIQIRDKLDIGYRIENQSVEIFEIRPAFDKPCEIIETPVAKATYVKRSGIWKIYWMKADLNWHRYEPTPDVDDLESFLSIIEEDQFGCFFG